jgi:hypothetical protein
LESGIQSKDSLPKLDGAVPRAGGKHAWLDGMVDGADGHLVVALELAVQEHSQMYHGQKQSVSLNGTKTKHECRKFKTLQERLSQL